MRILKLLSTRPVPGLLINTGLLVWRLTFDDITIVSFWSNRLLLVHKDRVSIGVEYPIACFAIPAVISSVNDRSATSRRHGIIIYCHCGTKTKYQDLLSNILKPFGDINIEIKHTSAGNVSQSSSFNGSACFRLAYMRRPTANASIIGKTMTAVRFYDAFW